MRWRLITLGSVLLAAVPVFGADAKRQSVTQTKPNVLGELKTVHKDADGRFVAESRTQTTPNPLGETKTVYRDSSGRNIGEAVTQTKPNALGSAFDAAISSASERRSISASIRSRTSSRSQ